MEWIKCSDRLPGISDGNYCGLILVFWDGWKMTVITVKRMLELEEQGDWNVTHWMNLEPPKED